MRVMKALSCFDKKSEILNLFLSISFAFTVYFFTPTELFLCNQQGLLSDSVHIILPMLLTASAVAGGIFLFINLFLVLHNKTPYIVVTRLYFGARHL